MFDSLQQKLLGAIQGSSGRGKLTEDSLSQVVSKIRMTLLESDVHFQVAKNFADGLQERLKSTDIFKTLTPEQTVLKGAKDQLIHLLGNKPIQAEFPIGLSSLMLVGLYGVGKTTHAVKLAHHFKTKGGRIPYLVSCDAMRPAAHEQLQSFAKQCGLWVMPPPDRADFNPVKRIKTALKEAKQKGADLLIIDTAGRSTLEDSLVSEIQHLSKKLAPQHTWLVLDSMLGQSSLQIAKAFHDACALTGNVLTKCDSDARGGVALSAAVVTGQPIFFMGVGERPEDLTPFDPERMAARILDLGDVDGLIEKASTSVDDMQVGDVMAAIQSGNFNFEHFRVQLGMLSKLGPLQGVMKLIPGMGRMMQGMQGGQFDKAEKQTKKFRAIIDSMTFIERKNPKILNGSRRKRIASGSGTSVQDINFLVAQFDRMKGMMKQMARFAGRGAL